MGTTRMRVSEAVASIISSGRATEEEVATCLGHDIGYLRSKIREGRWTLDNLDDLSKLSKAQSTPESLVSGSPDGMVTWRPHREGLDLYRVDLSLENGTHAYVLCAARTQGKAVTRVEAEWTPGRTVQSAKPPYPGLIGVTLPARFHLEGGTS